MAPVIFFSPDPTATAMMLPRPKSYLNIVVILNIAKVTALKATGESKGVGGLNPLTLGCQNVTRNTVMILKATGPPRAVRRELPSPGSGPRCRATRAGGTTRGSTGWSSNVLNSRNMDWKHCSFGS